MLLVVGLLACLLVSHEYYFTCNRGTFIEFRSGLINVSPIGRNASTEERIAYEKYDKEHKIREKFVSVLKEKFADLGLTYVQ